MDGQELLRQVLIQADRLDRHGRGMETGIAGLRIFRSPRPTEIEHEVFDPVYCLVLQGENHVRHEGAAHVVGPMHSFFVPIDLPLMSRIARASFATPYVSLALRLDMALLAELGAEMQADCGTGEPGGGLRPVSADPHIVDALARLVALIGQPEVACRVLEPLIRRELHYRLIASPHSAMLRGLLRPGGTAERIAHAVRTIRRAYAAPLAVEALAKGARMSASGFHAHFRAVTGTTPLQFQKRLRLIEARRLLQTGGHGVSAAAFAVGYESPTQFSREFSRRFGLAPSEVLRPTLRLSPRPTLRPTLRVAA